MDNFVTNTAAKSLPNQFGCQIFEVYNGSDLAGAYVGICENHTGQIDLYNGSDLAKFVQIDLAHQVAPLFVLLIVITPLSPSHLSQPTHPSQQQLTTTTRHTTPNNTLHNFAQLPTPPTFGDEDDDGVANLNAPGAPGMSVNVVVQPSSSPDWRRSPGSEGGFIAGRWRGD
jgi:hypothetical protein